MIKYFTVVLAVDEDILRSVRSESDPDEELELGIAAELGWVEASGITVHKITEDPLCDDGLNNEN